MRGHGDQRRVGQISHEAVDARVREGVHFRTSDQVGVDVGQKLATWELGQLHRLGV